MATILYRTGNDGGVEKGKFPAHRVQTLLKSSWRVTSDDVSPIDNMEIEDLRRELDDLGVNYHQRTGAKKLRQALEEAKDAAESELNTTEE
jgi:hypothetical protein